VYLLRRLVAVSTVPEVSGAHVLVVGRMVGVDVLLLLQQHLLALMVLPLLLPVLVLPLLLVLLAKYLALLMLLLLVLRPSLVER
jgi:hypothetical protein